MDNYVRCVYEPVATVIEESTKLPDEYGFNVYPNPFNSSVNISVDDSEKIQIFDIFGKLLFENDSVETTIDRGNTIHWTPDSNIPSGMFIVRVSGNSSQSKMIYYIK